MSLNVPDNIRIMNEAFKEFADNNNLKRLIFLRGESVSSDISFDSNGNVITRIENENDVVNKSLFEYDNKGRVSKISHYSPDGNFRYGYEFEYLENGKITFKNPGRVLDEKEQNFPIENKRIRIDYGLDEEITSRTVEFFDENKDLKQKQQYYQGKLNREFIYLSNGGEKYEVEINYLEDGKKLVDTTGISTNNIIDGNDNILMRYSGDFMVSEHKYNEYNRLLSSVFYSRNNGAWKKENYKYRNDTILIEKSENNLLTGEKIIYKFVYNKEGLLEQILKTDGTEEVFKYEYIFE